MINIRNSNVTININSNPVSEAKDMLLTKLYYARNKGTIGGYGAWQKLLNMYYMGNYGEMKELIQSCKGRGGKTRNECINYLEIIINGGI